MPKPRNYIYYVKKPQAVTNNVEAQANNIKTALYQNNKLISFCYYPIVVRHNAYENEQIKRICQIFKPNEIKEEDAILDLGGFLSSRSNLILCNKLNLTLEQITNPPSQTTIRKRLQLYYPKYGEDINLIPNKLSRIKEINLKFSSIDEQETKWSIFSVSTLNRIRVKGSYQNQTGGSSSRSGSGSGGGNRP